MYAAAVIAVRKLGWWMAPLVAFVLVATTILLASVFKIDVNIGRQSGASVNPIAVPATTDPPPSTEEETTIPPPTSTTVPVVVPGELVPPSSVFVATDPEPFEVPYGDIEPETYRRVFEDPCPVLFQGVTRLCMMSDMSNGNYDYVPGTEFRVAARLYIETEVDFGCLSIDECLETMSARELTDMEQIFTDLAITYAQDSTLNGGVPNVQEDDVIVSFWDAEVDNRRIRFENPEEGVEIQLEIPPEPEPLPTVAPDEFLVCSPDEWIELEPDDPDYDKYPAHGYCPPRSG